jgi:hypothetical protein
MEHTKVIIIIIIIIIKPWRNKNCAPDIRKSTAMFEGSVITRLFW